MMIRGGRGNASESRERLRKSNPDCPMMFKFFAPTSGKETKVLESIEATRRVVEVVAVVVPPPFAAVAFAETEDLESLGCGECLPETSEEESGQDISNQLDD